jgi:ParB-like chromosome segregation protein Spo0J
MIVEQLQGLAHPLKKLKLLPGNPRKGDVAAVKRSYERFGQRKPIVAKTDGTIISGNHQFLAAKALGWTEIAVVFVDDDDKTAKAFSLADNRISDLGTYDTDALAQMLQEIADDTDLLFDTGYDEKFLEALLTPQEIDEEIRDDFEIIDPDDIETAYACPSCGYEWSGNPQPNKAKHEPSI